jgi:hypothetical protein
MLLTRFGRVPKLVVAQVSSAKRRRCRRPAGEQETSREAIAESTLGHFFACSSNHIPTAGPERLTSTALRLLGVLDVLSSTPASSSRRAPCIRWPLGPLATERDSTSRLGLNSIGLLATEHRETSQHRSSAILAYATERDSTSRLGPNSIGLLAMEHGKTCRHRMIQMRAFAAGHGETCQHPPGGFLGE